ncbi:MAG: S41 family peptidase [Gemmataceae bacterium]|nr:S41 family peptidase [Gemmata sp.]MDW8196540.1 S41 family peptidase [Gemmataceae bacterium]
MRTPLPIPCRGILLLALVSLWPASVLAQPAKASAAELAQLRQQAEKHERNGDWEAAFTAYCHLYVADRTSPALREKLHTVLRRVQQIRRHRDPSFQQFVAGLTLPNGLDLFAEVIQRVPSVYADKEKATPQNLWQFAVEELDRALGHATFTKSFVNSPTGHKLNEFRDSLRSDWAKRPIRDHREARSTLRQLIATAQDQLAVRVPAALAVEAACGACSGLDEYTVFLTPTSPTDIPPAVDLTAAGLHLAIEHDQLIIDYIAPHSWVALNYPELKRGQRILLLNGRTMTGAGLSEALAALRHPSRGMHQLEVTTSTGEMTVVIPISIPSVYGIRMMPGTPVGYIRIGTFLNSTPAELDDAIATLKASEARAIIIDLRGNHGGSFLAAVETARRLLPAGVIVSTQGQVSDIANQVFTSTSGMSAHDIPLVLLIDTETASAAEVLAAALKDNDRAEIVGMPSFGKGTIQYPLRLVTLDDVDPTTGQKRPKTGTVRLTIAKLIAPTSGPISGLGVIPDIVESNPTLQIEVATKTAIEKIGSTMMPMPPLLPMNP